MYTATQTQNIFTQVFGQKMIDWKQATRTMYFVDVLKKTASLNTTSTPDRLNGLFNTTFKSVSVAEDGSMQAEWIMAYTLSGKRANYRCVSTLFMEDGVLHRTNYMELYDVILNLNHAGNTAAIEQARKLFNLAADASVPDVIREMATARSTFKFDPYQYAPGDLVVDIATAPVSNGRVKVSAKLLKLGAEVAPDKIRWEVWPGQAPNGLPDTISNRNASAQFPSGTKDFLLTTDLRDREAWQIMGAGSVRIVCLCTTKEDDGDPITIREEVEVPMGANLLQFNYFGL